MTAQEELDLIRPAAVGIAAIRVWCGVWFLIGAYSKLPLEGLASWSVPGSVETWAHACGHDSALPFFRPALAFVEAHATLASWLVLLLELTLGALLAIGLFTRIAASCSAFVWVSYWLATFKQGSAHVGLAMTLAVCALCVVLGDAGRFYGLDRLRLRKKTYPISLSRR